MFIPENYLIFAAAATMPVFLCTSFVCYSKGYKDGAEFMSDLISKRIKENLGLIEGKNQ